VDISECSKLNVQSSHSKAFSTNTQLLLFFCLVPLISFWCPEVYVSIESVNWMAYADFWSFAVLWLRLCSSWMWHLCLNSWPLKLKVFIPSKHWELITHWCDVWSYPRTFELVCFKENSLFFSFLHFITLPMQLLPFCKTGSKGDFMLMPADPII